MCLLNPIQTSSMRKNNVRKTKTDKVDTFVIAKTLMMQDSLRFMTLDGLDYIELKELGRFRQKLVKQRTRLKIQLTSYVDQVFPELQYFFKSACIRILSTPSLRGSDTNSFFIVLILYHMHKNLQ